MMKLTKKDWYKIWLFVDVILLISINELDIGLGGLAFLLMMPLAMWLMWKAYTDS